MKPRRPTFELLREKRELAVVNPARIAVPMPTATAISTNVIPRTANFLRESNFIGRLLHWR